MDHCRNPTLWNPRPPLQGPEEQVNVTAMSMPAAGAAARMLGRGCGRRGGFAFSQSHRRKAAHQHPPHRHAGIRVQGEGRVVHALSQFEAFRRDGGVARHGFVEVGRHRAVAVGSQSGGRLAAATAWPWRLVCSSGTTIVSWRSGNSSASTVSASLMMIAPPSPEVTRPRISRLPIS